MTSSIFCNRSVLSTDFRDQISQTVPITAVKKPLGAAPASLVAHNIFHKMIFPNNWHFLELTSGQTLYEFAEHWRTVMAAGYARICAALSRCDLTSPRRTTLEFYNSRWQDAIKKIGHGILPETIMNNLLHDLHKLEYSQQLN